MGEANELTDVTVGGLNGGRLERTKAKRCRRRKRKQLTGDNVEKEERQQVRTWKKEES